MKRALHLFETACFGANVMTDYQVRQILDLLTRTRVKIRQGHANMLVPAPVDFSSLGSEYIGILYEGLLDFELRCAVEKEPIVFLAVGNQPALPLSTLEQMDDRAIKNLLEKLKDTSSAGRRGRRRRGGGGRWLLDGEESEETRQEEVEEAGRWSWMVRKKRWLVDGEEGEEVGYRRQIEEDPQPPEEPAADDARVSRSSLAQRPGLAGPAKSANWSTNLVAS
jgi:hypothetical protein